MLGLLLAPLPRSLDPFPPLAGLEFAEELPLPDAVPASLAEAPVDLDDGAASEWPSPFEPLLARELLDPEPARESVE